MGHPRRRTWTLTTLERDVTYALFFDAAENRWEVRHPAHLTGTLTTRPPAGNAQSATGPDEGEAKPPSRTVPDSAFPAGARA